MANPHPFDLLIQAHRDGRFLDELELELHLDRYFNPYTPRPPHHLPFITMLAAEPDSYDNVMTLLEMDHYDYEPKWAALGAGLSNQIQLLTKLVLFYKQSEPTVEEIKNWALLGAAKGNHRDLVKHLLETVQASSDFAIQGAAWNGDAEWLAQLPQGKSARLSMISGAAWGGQTQLLKKLNVSSDDEYFALIQGAALGNQTTIIKGYLEREIEVFDAWYSELLMALRQEDWVAVEKQLAGNTVIDRIHPKHGMPVVAKLTAEPHSLQAVKALLDAGAQSRWAVLGAAIANNDVSLNWLLRQGADIDWAVQGAAIGGHAKLVDTLLELGASHERAIEGAAQSNQCDLLTRLLIQPDEISVSAAVRGAAKGGHTHLVWKCLEFHLPTLLPEYDGTIASTLIVAAFEGIASAGHVNLRGKIEEMLHRLSQDGAHLDDVPISFILMSYAAQGGHYSWVEDLLTEFPLHHGTLSKVAQHAATGGHLAMTHRLAQLSHFTKVGEDYCSPIEGAAKGGHPNLVEYFVARQTEIQSQWGHFESCHQDRADNLALYGASISHHSLIVERLLKLGANPESRNNIHYFYSIRQAAYFLAGIRDIQLRSSYANYPNLEKEEEGEDTPKLGRALPIAHLMTRYGLAFEEAHTWHRNSKQLMVVFELQQKKIGNLYAELWQKIACFAAANEDAILSVSEMVNIQNAIQTIWARARTLCGPATNFNGNALKLWLQTCATTLKGRIWPAQQAKGHAFEALLKSFTISDESLDAEDMLNNLERRNDQGQSLRSLLETLPSWKALLERFPSIAKQLELRHEGKRLCFGV